jgi:predicted PurR-regulated permease PerM
LKRLEEDREGSFVLIGILITTVGISLLTLGLVGASIEVYRQLLSALVQQQVSALTQQLPEILRPEGPTTAEEVESPLDSTSILGSLIENLISNPLWLVLVVVGIVLIYFGLYITQRQTLRNRP